MKTLLKNTMMSVLVLSFFFIFSISSIAQEDGDDSPPVMAEIAFMKTKPGGNYLDVEQKMWKPLHQERINRGELAGWYLWEIRYPQGTETLYNYVTVNVYNDPAKQLKPVDGPFMDDILKKVHPDVSAADIFAKTEDSRDMKWMGLYILNESTWGEGPPDPPVEFIRVNFFKVDEANTDDYVSMETEVFMPFHEAMVEAGAGKGWQLWTKFSPRGVDHGTSHITVDYHGSWEDMTGDNGVDGEAVFKKVHPDKTQSEVFKNIAKIRTTARSETWRLVDYVNKAEE